MCLAICIQHLRILSVNTPIQEEKMRKFAYKPNIFDHEQWGCVHVTLELWGTRA